MIDNMYYLLVLSVIFNIVFANKKDGSAWVRSCDRDASWLAKRLSIRTIFPWLIEGKESSMHRIYGRSIIWPYNEHNDRASKSVVRVLSARFPLGI